MHDLSASMPDKAEELVVPLAKFRAELQEVWAGEDCSVATRAKATHKRVCAPHVGPPGAGAVEGAASGGGAGWLKKDASSLALPAAADLIAMNGQRKGSKRARTQPHDGTDALANTPGRDQLLLTSRELQTRLGQKFCDETEILPMLLAHGLVRRVRTIQIAVRPLGGDSFKITLDASLPTVKEAKVEIARAQGTATDCQELYRVAERADGLAVREDDAEPELLEDESMILGEGDVVAMAVKDSPLLWRTFAADRVLLSEEGAVATQQILEGSLTTTGIELTEGKHYWEVEMLSAIGGIIALIGVTRPNLDPTGAYFLRDCTDGWFVGSDNGTLFGNGKYSLDGAGGYDKGDRVGVLLNLDDGSLRFFKNGAQHGPGYPAGSVTGPVVAAVQMRNVDDSVRLLPDAEVPAGY
jgi:hypothetical protein